MVTTLSAYVNVPGRTDVGIARCVIIDSMRLPRPLPCSDFVPSSLWPMRAACARSRMCSLLARDDRRSVLVAVVVVLGGGGGGP